MVWKNYEFKRLVNKGSIDMKKVYCIDSLESFSGLRLQTIDGRYEISYHFGNKCFLIQDMNKRLSRSFKYFDSFKELRRYFKTNKDIIFTY